MYTEFLAQWTEILTKMTKNNGFIHPIEIGEKATLQEVIEKEQEVGYPLPPSYKEVVLNFAKSLSFYYSFSEETILPDEFREIFSGEIQWNLSEVESLNELADNLVEDGDDFGHILRDKLQLSSAGNGDLYIFDMAVEREEKPILYWNHEESTLTYIADSFIQYLEKITELRCIGSEKWQLEPFLNENGLDTSSEMANRWNHWFESFSETRIEDVQHDIHKLLSYSIYRNKVDEKTINAFLSFGKKQLSEVLLTELEQTKTFSEQRVICEIIGLTLGSYVEEWVEKQWNEENGLEPRLLSYLSAICLDSSKGLTYVFRYLENMTNGKIHGYDAYYHLEFFHSSEVIVWMENQLHFPVNEGWSQLFAKSNPAWKDIERWSKLEDIHEATIIHALEDMVDQKMEEPNTVVPLKNVPSQEEFTLFLNELKAKQITRKRRVAIEKVLEHLGEFYYCGSEI